MDLKFNYLKIRKIAKEVRKTYKINSLVEIVQYVFSDDEILSVFIREGAELKTNSEADALISDAMETGIDYFDIQQEVVKGLIDANFYKKELQEMLNSLTVSATQEN